MRTFRNPLILFLALIFLILSVSVYAEVPQLINYQGRLSDNGENPVSGDLSITFTIYDAEGGVCWQEVQVITVDNGFFNVLLGTNGDLTNNCFVGDTNVYLGIKVGEDPELEPRVRLTTAPYAFHALRADTAEFVLGGPGPDGWYDDGDIIHLFDEKDTVRVGEYNGGAKLNISENFNETGQDITGLGVWTEVVDEMASTAGYFSASSGASSAIAVDAVSSSTTADTVFGGRAVAANYGGGMAVGLSGEAACDGSGGRVGVRGIACGSGPGLAFGGFFKTEGSLTYTNSQYGLFSQANSFSSSTAFGIYSEGYSDYSGNVYGGYFTTGGGGSGERYGIWCDVAANNSNFTSCISGQATNSGDGSVVGASFFAMQPGTGWKYGMTARAESNSDAMAFGTSTSAFNSSNGTVYGVYSNADGTSGKTYGGYFEANGYGDSAVYAVNAVAEGNNSSWGVTGVYGKGTNTGTGTAYGGLFAGSSSGTGAHYGVYAMEAFGGSGAAIYASGDFAASGTKSAVMRTSQGSTLMYAMESAEVWFEDFGEGQLMNGQVHIELDPLFLEMVTINSANPMKVFIQLNDDCNGTYVKTSNTGFDVRELQGGNSDAAFTYRVIAKRAGYENERMRTADIGKDDPKLYPERAGGIYRKWGAMSANQVEPDFDNVDH